MRSTRALSLLGVLLATACSNGDEPTRPAVSAPQPHVLHGVAYAARTDVMESFPVQVVASVTLHNETTSPVEVVFPDGCVVLLRAYGDASRGGEPAWDQGRFAMCTAALVEVELTPGAKRTLRGATFSARDVLGDSLPNGRYYLSAVVRPDQGRIELPAGVVDLAI